MYKKKILVIIVITILVITFLECTKIKTNNLIKNDNIILNNLNNKKQEIIIYDIEDGFINVPYNEKAKKMNTILIII